jgi:predicted MPP superfamily phosphohydrolase
MIKKLMTLEINTLILLLGLLTCLIFILIDGISLKSLPILEISYGGVRLPLTAFAFLRVIFFISWFILFGETFISRLLLRWHILNRASILNQFPILILLGVNLLFLVFEIYIFFIEPMRLTVTRLSIDVPGLQQPVRIVQLSDIHVELTSRRELALPKLVNSLEPDMVVMTGDYLNESYRRSPISQQNLKNLITQIQAPLGIYAVNGNVETRVNMDSIFEGLDANLIDNEIVRIPQSGDDIVLVGLEYSHWYDDDDTLMRLMGEVKPEDFSILLYHKPDLAYTARDLGIDLYLTGHTHGGQFRLPFYGAIITDTRFGKEFEMGLYHLGNTIMYISRGIGMAGGIAPRVRFLCPPEVVVVDLVPQN